MSLINFLKAVGAQLGNASHDKPATAEELKAALAKHGFAGVDVAVQGNVVSLSGKASSTEEAEKIALAVGNTIGVSQVDNALSVEAPGPAANMVTVQKGETLAKIAEAAYGKGKGLEGAKRIFEANKPMLKSADRIYPGQVLRVPK